VQIKPEFTPGWSSALEALVNINAPVPIALGASEAIAPAASPENSWKDVIDHLSIGTTVALGTEKEYLYTICAMTGKKEAVGNDCPELTFQDLNITKAQALNLIDQLKQAIEYDEKCPEEYCILLKQKIAEVEEARYQDFLRRTPRIWTTFGRSIGNARCINNARSPYIQCAINPMGDCSDCKDYRDIVED
jgi:hypothetical protein